jgi:hypothetical protein
MAIFGSLFHHGARPDQPDSLFGDVLAGSRGKVSPLAALGASTGTSAPAQSFDAPMSPLPASRSPVLMGAPQAPQAPQGRGLLPPDTPAAAPSGGRGDAPDPSQMVQYAQELGIPIAQKHKFNVGRALLSFFVGVPAAQAILHGDYASAQQYNLQSRAGMARIQDQNAKRQLEQAHDLAIYSAMRHSGLSRDDAMLAMSNTDEFGKNYNTRFRTDDVAEGHVRYQPNLDGSASRMAVPKMVQHEGDFAFVSPPDGAAPPANGFRSSAGPPPMSDGQAAAAMGSPPAPAMRGGPPMLPPGSPSAPFLSAPPAIISGAGSLRTAAEQYADTLYQRGTPQWRSAVQDAMLKANGPTAFRQDQQLQGARLDVQMRGQNIDQGNNMRTNATSAANNTRSTNASMANRNATPAAIGVDANGNQVITYPNNRVVQTHGIRPVSSAARRGRQGGGAGGATEGATATGPGGHKIIVRGGRWVDAQSGAPVQ